MSDTVKSEKDFVHVASELTDQEAQAAFRTIVQITNRYSRRANTAENLEHLRDEVLTKLAEQNVIATFDPTPCFYGEPPIVQLEGKIASDNIHKYGFDHERKESEIKKAHARGEDYLGEKYAPDSTPARKRNKNEQKKHK